MYILRSFIKKQKNNAKKYFKNQKKLGINSKIYLSAKIILRNSNFTVNYEKAISILDNIDFIYNDIDKHWAETDGKSISLNTFKYYTNSLLYYTLIHEALHNIILRNNKHFIPEEKEHLIMKLINKKLI